MFLSFETGSHVAKAGLKLTINLRMSLDSGLSCGHLLSAGSKAMHHHAQLKNSVFSVCNSFYLPAGL